MAAATLSPATLETHRVRHTYWNITALLLINGFNLLWLHSIWLGTNSSSRWDLATDLAMVGYQVLESVIDVSFPHVTSSLRAALTHHAVTAGGMIYMRCLAASCAQPLVIDLIKHEIVLVGECQNVPRMMLRVMRRGSLSHAVVSSASDAMLILRLLWWPLIVPKGLWALWLVGQPAVFCAALPLVLGHFVVYAQQLKLFQRDVERLWDSLRALLAPSKPKAA